MPSPRYFILTALQSEANAIAKAFGSRGPKGDRPAELAGARTPVELYVVGMGAIRIPDLSGRACAGIIMAGLGGALDPRLNVGDVVADQSSTWRASRITLPKVWFHTTERAVVTPEEKSRLFGETGAAVVEMENATVKRAAKSFSIPFLGVRAVGDTAAEAIDPAVLEFVNPFGGVRLGNVIGAVARRPALIKHMRHLSRSSKTALAALAEAVKAVITPASGS